MKSHVIADKELLKSYEQVSEMRMTKKEIMKYKVVIQENLENGSIYFHDFPLAPLSLQEGLRFRSMHYHSDCFFIVEYSLN